MRTLLTIASVLFFCVSAHAEPASSVSIRQMNPKSKMVTHKEVTNDAATPAGAPVRTIGDDLKDILKDENISELGRANKAISSQYGGEPIVETGEPATKAGTEKSLLLEEKKR